MGRRTLAVLLLTAGLLACGSDPKLTEGEVIDKKVDPESTYFTQVCVAYGKYGCSVYMPVQHRDPAEWLLLIEGEADGKLLREWHEVGVDAWNETEQGDWWAE